MSQENGDQRGSVEIVDPIALSQVLPPKSNDLDSKKTRILRIMSLHAARVHTLSGNVQLLPAACLLYTRALRTSSW